MNIMKIFNNLYNYSDLKKSSINGKRFYTTPNGENLPSVTTILDKTKSKEAKEALANWKKNVGEERAQQITTEAANRGTRMHTYLEQFIKNGNMPERGSNPYSWPSYAMAEEVINKGLTYINEIWGVEVPLYFPKLYAGTTDGAGLHNNVESIFDYKQSNKPKKREWISDYFLQIVAYAEAHNELYHTKINKGVILMCVKPTVDKQYQIIDPPIYQEFIIEGQEFETYRQLWWSRLEEYYTKYLN